MLGHPVSATYGAVMAIRNSHYDRVGGQEVHGVKVVSVGNLVIGGTGKTPISAWVARALEARNLKPAIVSRGYGKDGVTTLTSHLFNTTNLGRIYLHTLSWNVRAQKSFKKCGFVPVRQVKRSSYDFILMELLKERWEGLLSGSISLEEDATEPQD